MCTQFWDSSNEHCKNTEWPSTPVLYTPCPPPPIILSDLLCFLRPALTVFQNREFLKNFSVVYWYDYNFPWLSRSISMILGSHLNFWTWITFKLFQSFILTEVFLNYLVTVLEYFYYYFFSFLTDVLNWTILYWQNMILKMIQWIQIWSKLIVETVSEILNVWALSSCEKGTFITSTH